MKPIDTNYQQRFTNSQKEFLIAAILRLPNLFKLAKENLKPEHFNNLTEMPYMLLWKATLTIASKNKDELPPDIQAKEMITLEASVLCDNAPSSFTMGSNLESLFTLSDNDVGFIDKIYQKPIEAFNEEYCIDLLKKFLSERVIFDPFKKFLERYGDTAVPADIDPILEKLKSEKEKLENIDVSPVSDIAITNWQENALEQIPSNVSFIDEATAGGPALGEVIILLGASGSGKTLAGIQLGVEGARYQIRQANQKKPSGYWFYFSYECAIHPDIRQRVISCAAKIDWGSLKSLKAFTDLSSSTALKEYETKRWRAKIEAGIQIPGEQERYKAAMEELGDRLKLVDMSGAIAPSIGTKGIPEMVKILERAKSQGQQPIGIIIDYAGILVSRYLAANNEKVENQFIYLNRFVNDVRVEIASRFNCICWVLHQLHGDAAILSSTAKQHHSRASGARNFADNANFAFNIGTKDVTNDCCIITCTKSRRSSPLRIDPIVKVDGAVNAMIAMNQTYALDPAQRRIIEKQTMSSVIDPFISGSILRKPKTLQDPLSAIDMNDLNSL